MGFRSGAYARVWSLEKGNGNYYVADMSTSKKDANGEYIKDWSNKFVRLVGTAAKKAESLTAPVNIRIGNCEVSNHYDTDRKIMYTNYVIFSFDDDNSSDDTKTNAKQKENVDDETFVTVPEGINEELPFV